MQTATVDIPILVYGATLAGIGMALQNPRDTMVVDKGMWPGNEFVSAFNLGSKNNWVASSEYGIQLKKVLLDREVLSAEGDVSITVLSPILCNMILESNLNVLLMTTITAVERLEHGFRVTMFNNSGLQSLVVGRIIDTTSEGLLISEKGDRILGKSINAGLCASKAGLKFPFEEEAIKKNQAISYCRGKNDDEIYMKLQLELNDNWITARKKLHDFWQNRPECLSFWNLLAVANAFDFTVKQGMANGENGISWLASCAYTNPIEALEAGVAFVRGGAVR